MKNFKFLAAIVIVQVFLGIILFSSAYAMWGGGGVEPPEIIIPPDPSPSPIIDVNKDVKEEYIDINGQHLLAQKVTTTTITGDGFSTKTTAVVSFAYDENGNLVDAKGTQHSETISQDGSKSVSDTQEQYTVKDGQALLTSSKTMGEAFDASGAQTGNFIETKNYNYEFIGGNYQLIQTVSASQTLNIDGSSEDITRTTSYQRDANGQITGVTQIATGERKTVVGIDASGNKIYQTQVLQNYQATFAYDAQEGWYLSMEAYTWADKPSADKLLGDLNGDAVVDISDVILVLRQAKGLDPMTKDADIDQNGVVDINDAISTLRLALGLELDIVNPTPEGQAIQFLANYLGISADQIKVVGVVNVAPEGLISLTSRELFILTTADGGTHFLVGGFSEYEGGYQFKPYDIAGAAQIISRLDLERAVNILSNVSPEVAAQILTAQEPIWYIAEPTTTIYPRPVPMPTYPIISPTQSAKILSAMSPEQAAVIVTCFFRQGEKLEIPGDIVSIPEKPVLQRPNPVSPIVKNIIRALDRIDHKAMRLILRHLDRETRRLVMSILRQRLPIIRIDGPLPLHTAGV